TALWCLARLTFLWGGDTAFRIGAASESAFFIISAFCLMRVMVKGQSRRNYGLPLLVLGLGLINMLYLQAVLAGDYGLLIDRFNLG
ncbi:NnrS family protein, partial [Klebsiella pneumoniae]